MKHNITLVYEEPNIESTIPVSIYHSSSPENFSLDDDKLVLYAGGTNYKLNVLNNDPTQTIEVGKDILNIDISSVSIYVLNTSFILWFNQGNIGLNIPYQVIVLHALQESKLYLQMISSPYLQSIRKEDSRLISCVELSIEYNGSNVVTNALINKNSSIEGLYEGMSKCSSFHYDDDSDDDDFIQQSMPNSETPQKALEIPSSWLESGAHPEEAMPYRNLGDADDLESYDDNELNNDDLEHVAGMSVDVGFAPIAGSIRKREEELDSSKKSRKLY